jgi:alcohol dehydrogenase (cytochrome c)
MRNQVRIFLSLAMLIGVAAAQSVDPQLLLNPPADAWLTYHGDYNGQRHSKLTQITPQNVGNLKQV